MTLLNYHIPIFYFVSCNGPYDSSLGLIMQSLTSMDKAYIIYPNRRWSCWVTPSASSTPPMCSGSHSVLSRNNAFKSSNSYANMHKWKHFANEKLFWLPNTNYASYENQTICNEFEISCSITIRQFHNITNTVNRWMLTTMNHIDNNQTMTANMGIYQYVCKMVKSLYVLPTFTCWNC